VLQEILYRAAAAGDEDVEGHLDLHASIAATTLAVAAALGLTAANTAVTTAQAPRTQPPFHTTGQSQHHSGQWVVDDKGGMEYVP
jgi:hypothetical protein